MSNSKLSRIELFAFDTRPSFIHGSEPSGCWYGVLKLTCGQQISYGKCILCAGDNAVDLIKWGSFLKHIRNCTIEEAFELIRLHGQEWAPNQSKLLQAALDNMLQTGQLRTKVVAGAGRYEHRANTCLSSREPVLHYIKQFKSHLDSSLLFNESVYYYSLV
ncbi:hypothetical protein [Paenibacillus graminis]|uniref:hypothetical protein n=1 Tax=Paenibacillus graminis TaxID=189425 RepID=UPI000FA4F6C6|nr:hypothetical protein [Paenibacillus graminis]MEC0167330.1 hypothetical protein [Paenibacillus graminis]